MKSRLDALSNRVIPALLVIYLIFLIIFGVRYHVMEVPASSEWDGYALKIDELRSGSLPRDPYRPLLYSLLASAAAEMVGDSFAGGRLVSSLFAIVFIFIAWRIGRFIFGEPVGSITVLFLMLNFHVATYGMGVSTDMMFAALVSAVLLVSLLMVKDPGPGKAVFIGFLFATAFFTRYTAAFILPVPVVSIMISRSDRGKSGKLFLVGLFLVSALIFLVPHFVLNTMVFGSPLYNENWRNVAFKLYGEGDWAKFGETRFKGPFDVVLSDPARWLRLTAVEIARFFTSTMYYFGGKGIAGYLFIIAGAAGLVAMALRMDRRRAVVILFILLVITGGCATFVSGVRFMMPVMGLYYMMLAGLAAGAVMNGTLYLRSGVRVVSALLAAVFILATIHTGVRHMGMYIDAHPVEELEAARKLEREYGTGITVLGTFPFMQRHVGYRYVELEISVGRERTSPSEYFDRMEAQVRREGARFVIVGRATLSMRPLELLDAADLPDFIVLHDSKNAVSVYETVEREAK